MRTLLSLALLLLSSSLQAKANYDDAARKAAEAAYIQSGISENVDRYLQNVERKFVPVFIINNGGVFAFVAQTIYSEQFILKYQWSFP